MRPDLAAVADLVPHRSRVLDLGCGDGELLADLIAARDCVGTGIESDGDGVLRCLARGLSVLQADIDDGLADFADGSFDVVVLSQTLQAVRRPALVLSEVTRVGGLGIVSFPNFGYWRHRVHLALHGRMPVSDLLPHAWHDTPNIHLCTIRDFEELLRALGLRATRRVLLGSQLPRPNLLASGAIYLIAR